MAKWDARENVFEKHFWYVKTTSLVEKPDRFIA